MIFLSKSIEGFVRAFGWMLLHSLWQGMLLVIATAIVLSIARRSKSSIKYTILVISFLSFLACCILTFTGQWQAYHDPIIPSSLPLPVTAISATVQPASPMLIDRDFWQQAGQFLSRHINQLVLAWSVFFIVQLVRTGAGFLTVRRLRHGGIKPSDQNWERKLEQLSEQLQVRQPVRLLESSFVAMPVVTGYFKPIILMPAGLLVGLPPAQLEAVLLHELAHIRRKDYLVHLLQLFCKTLFFFNPAFVWLSAKLREQREYCCDDMAVSASRAPLVFVEALVAFTSYSLQAKGALPFSDGKGQLYQRAGRILRQPLKVSFFSVSFFGSTVFAAVLFCAVQRAPIHSRGLGSLGSAIPMDSVTLSYLTGEFNAELDHIYYQMSVANSRITQLRVDGQMVPPAEFPAYYNVLAALVARFKYYNKQYLISSSAAFPKK